MRDTEGMGALLQRLLLETDKIDKRVIQEITSLWEWGIERIHDDALRTAVRNYYIKWVPYRFFISPSSSMTSNAIPHSQKRHPYWHNRPGGIVRHLTECCIEASRLLSLWGYADESGRAFEEVSDIVLAATLITDTQKNGIPWNEKTNPDHGRIAAQVWDRVALGCDVRADLRDRVVEAVSWHYGRYTPADIPKTFKGLPDAVQIVHLLDALSANRDKALIYKPVDAIPSPESLS